MIIVNEENAEILALMADIEALENEIAYLKHQLEIKEMESK